MKTAPIRTSTEHPSHISGRSISQLELMELRKELVEWKTLGRRLSSIFERAPVGIFIKDSRGVYIHANPTAASVLGRDLNELLGSTDEDVFGRDVALELRDIDQYVFTTNRPFRYEARRLTAAGERVFQTTKWPMAGDDTQAAAIIAMSRDITEQKYAQEYYNLQRVVSRTLERSRSLDEALFALLTSFREVFNCDIAFLWRTNDEEQMVLAAHEVERPGFGTELIETSTRTGLGEEAPPDLTRASVTAIDQSSGFRAGLAKRAGLVATISLPLAGPSGPALIELMSSEIRTSTVPLLENLDEARRRLDRFAELLSLR